MKLNNCWVIDAMSCNQQNIQDLIDKFYIRTNNQTTTNQIISVTKKTISTKNQIK